MTESAPTPATAFAHGPIVWDDEIWVLARHEAGDRLGLTLHHREEEGLGQLSDEHASQLGRIGNRLVRIIEHLPGAGRVDLGRVTTGSHVQLTFEFDGVTEAQLHEVAVKLANWGGIARA
ncbi:MULTISPECIES: hypothetical protein [unclassified Nocardioides]|jgi:hypothetical protein|uniref:hypothetical protein n=1 Tax=unclassified Nocardioides TaxID=2615069 RepID=UPI0007024F54|nr:MULTISPECIES: hypothetical protein [unclassified Nocardioides]KRC53981.1 hypothetical protein ASE19_07855 [Nocardioides sp. Root79]KRC71317.1 hypothetical protein ASE20_10270 [Nocardioides sp. Root240]